MAKLSVLAGATSQSVNLFVQDSSSTTGAGLTGLVFNTSGLTAYYSFAGANATATSITLATLSAVNSAYSSGGFKEIDSTNMPGWYRFDIPNAAIVGSKGRSVGIHFKGATNMAPLPLEIELTGWDNQDAVRGGLTAFPNVASGSAGALLIDGTGTAAIANNSGKVLLQATQSGVTIPTVTTVTNQLTAAAIATGIWQDTTAGDFTTASSIGKSLYTTGNAPGAASGLALVGSNVGSASSVTGAVGSVTGAVGSVTGNVGGNVTGSVGSVASGGITNASFAADTGLKPIRSNTAQAGAGTTITLDASASASDSFYNNTLILLTGGTGAGQARFISAYVGSTKVATVATWVTNPDNTTTFAILPFDAVAGASAPTAAQVATAVWQDLTSSSDFTTVSSIGKLLVTDIDAAISSRMATYTQPTGFLAATFPTTVASPTNITAGTITTATNLTNAPTAGDFTATMKTSIGTAVAASAVASVTGAVGSIGSGGIANTSFAAGAIDAAAIATDAIGSAELATSAVDEIWQKACTEPTAVVSASPQAIAALSWLLTLSRNKLTQTATTQTILADDGSTTVAASTVSDDGTTGTRGKFA